MKKRYLTNYIVKDLKEKIVLIAGPRQVGKTTLAQLIGKDYFNPYYYLNWDYQPDRKKIINFELPAEKKLIIFDELHKYKNWKNYIKGIFDKYKTMFSILVTGSAKLDIYRRGGDSLFGRYYYYLLHPFSLGELLEIEIKNKPLERLKMTFDSANQEALTALLKFGPFPEPFIKQKETHWRRWQIERIDRLVREEIRDLTTIVDLSNLQILVDLLPTRVGSPFSINNVREDLGVAHKTLANYLKILELFCFHFRIYPYVRKTIRSLKKMAKLYLWDWSVLEEPGAKFENLIAFHLLKFVNFLQSTQGYKAELFYLRDTEGREVDFLVLVDKKVWFAVEAKLVESSISSLLYFGRKLSIPFLYQVVAKPGIDYLKNGVRVVSADKFLTAFV